MKLAYTQNSELWKENATGVGSYGVLYEINNELFVDGIPLVEYVKQFSGRKCMFEFVFPDEVEGYEIDEGIKTLVEKLQAKGIQTIGSCEGHLPGHSPYGKQDSTVPMVRYYGEMWSVCPENWHIEPTQHKNVWQLTANVNIQDESSLQRAKELIESAVQFYS